MGLFYENLDGAARRVMLEEILAASSSGSLYEGKRLTAAGREAWPGLLLAAARSETDDWLAEQLQVEGLLVSHEETKRGPRRVNPRAASANLAQGQFNFFYCIAVCVIAMELEEDVVEIYRAKHTTNPRSSSEELVGTTWPPIQLLSDLRQSGGIEPAIGLARPNSGLSVRRVLPGQ